MEFTLTHDGECWCARADGIHVRAETLTALDDALLDRLRESGREDWPVNVVMRFDRSTLPDWMRQYAYHYFNRHVRFTRRKIQSPAE